MNIEGSVTVFQPSFLLPLKQRAEHSNHLPDYSHVAKIIENIRGHLCATRHGGANKFDAIGGEQAQYLLGERGVLAARRDRERQYRRALRLVYACLAILLS